MYCVIRPCLWLIGTNLAFIVYVMKSIDYGGARMRICILFAIVTAIIVGTASLASADATTFQKWTFATDANPGTPDVVDNAYGAPSAAIDFDSPNGSGWIDSMSDLFGPAQGFWDIGMGSITLDIPNAAMGAGSATEVQVDVTYWLDISDAADMQLTPDATFVDKTTSLVEEGPIGGGWYRDHWTWQMTPSADSQHITVLANQDWGSIIDEVSVTTTSTSVPEPGVLPILSGIIGFAGLRMRRRKA
jgi:hypothetical protein